MRINSLDIANFKGFAQREFSFAPHFNLIIGNNGTGKTSVLDALAVAVGSWLLGFRDFSARHILPDEVRLAARTYDGEIRFEEQYPVTVSATGEIFDETLTWSRSLNSAKGRTTYGDAAHIKFLATGADSLIRQGNAELGLPLLSYYGTGRLWLEPRAESQVKGAEKLASQKSLSRLDGYQHSIDPRLSVRDLVRWIARQSWISYQQGKESAVFRAVKQAILGCMEDAENLYFDPKRGEVVVVTKEHGAQPFANLSDGQRSMLAMVGDMAQKAAKLNPQFGDKVLEETPGVVLIDELDLHLPPRWQRRIIEDLRRTFPKIQFITTTHSPFLIQTLRYGEELIMLDGQPVAEFGNLGIETIARGIMGVARPEVSPRYAEQVRLAADYLEALEEAAQAPQEKLAQYKASLAGKIAPYADNPAFQAILEAERIARLGS
jgi:predicted ATP-binding protein involved in virulence